MQSMDLFKKLNANQVSAVMNESHACLVNAQVGSGKTTVLLAKVCFLYQFKNVSLSDMVVLTFTNKAANEIKDRLKAIDSGIKDEDLEYFGTFHSVALKLLKTFATLDTIGYTTNFAVMDAEEKTDLAREIIRSYQLDIKYENKLEKRLELAVRGIYNFGNMRYTDDMQILLGYYEQEKKTQDKMDFDDLIKNIVKLLPKIEYRPKWIIIDEFQDTDERQMAFIRGLTSAKTRLFAVGDPNQIIYSWRGSNQRIFDLFAREYGAIQLSLPENYRSSTTILEVAKCFLKSGSDLSGIREPGSKINVKCHYNSFNEAQYLANAIRSKVANGLNYNDIAIFYRTQRQSQVLEDVFSREGLPFEVSLKKKVSDIPILKWIILLLRASVNRSDRESAIAVISDTRYGEHLGKWTARRIVNESMEKANASIVQCGSLYALDGGTEMSDLLPKIVGFEKWCQGGRNVADIYSYYSLDTYIHPTSASFLDDKNSIMAFLRKIDEYITSKSVDTYTGIKEFINSSALYGIDILSDDEKSGTNTIKLMTLHSAKGLEFRQVYIIGVNYGLIPLRVNSYDEEQEEKRLFFVGITRAKDYLELSYYSNPDGAQVIPGQSRYISMIPSNLIESDDLLRQEVDIQKLRHEVWNSRQSQSSFTANKPPSEEISPMRRKVRHIKYGIGAVVSEDDSIITVLFKEYGKKEFIKVFSELEDIDE